VGQLGIIEFPASGSERAHPYFLRGVAALHSFWYEEAIEAFRQSTTLDPNFVMGYWGEAMAHNHPIWKEENMEAAQAALQRIPDEASSTLRERRYLHAVQTLFGKGDKPSRDQAYATEMESLASEYPDDREATCFYALSLLGLATHFDAEADIQEKYRVQAGALTLGVFRVNPDHPCAAHYTIHAFDDPIHAILALPQARRYAKIAPEAHHAQHMPAHIFLQLGMWDEAAASNKAGWESSQAWVKREQLPPALQDYHSLSWLHYVYLQQGRYKEAEAVLAEKQRDMTQSPSGKQTQVRGYDRTVSRNYDQMVAAYIMETQRWEQAAHSWDVDGYHFGDEAPVKAAFIREFAQSMQRIGQGTTVQDDPQGSASLPPEKITKSESDISRIWSLQLAALKQVINGDHSQAINLLDQAVTLENQLPPPSGPPALIKPTHELYGEILLRIDRPQDAQRHFKRSLLWHANRARSLIGLARAAARMGEVEYARQAYATLLVIWDQADTELPELHEAKQFLQHTTPQ
jgi:tetratricopeptide (TPR) repeat protein